VTNPFESDQVSYLILTNLSGACSLWPSDLPQPLGWSIVFGPASRGACLEYVNQHWTGMQPRVRGTAPADAARSRRSRYS
jgi:MbtH protein